MSADIVVAATIACEVPPVPYLPGFPDTAIPLAIEAVCEVIRNRVAAGYARSPEEVVLEPHQFSCVMTPPWQAALAGRWRPVHVGRCLLTWVRRREPPLLPGVLHYYSPISMTPPGAEPPWVPGLRELLLPGVDPYWFRWFT